MANKHPRSENANLDIAKLSKVKAATLYREKKDFSFRRRQEKFRWTGLGDFDELNAKETFDSENEALADALFTLHFETGAHFVDALLLPTKFDLPMEALAKKLRNVVPNIE